MQLMKTLTMTLFAILLLAGAVMAQDPVRLYPDNYKVLLENDRVRVLDFQLRQGAKENLNNLPWQLEKKDDYRNGACR